MTYIMQPVPHPMAITPKNFKRIYLPKKLKNPPITVRTVHLPRFLTTKANPFKADVQNEFPSKAI